MPNLLVNVTFAHMSAMAEDKVQNSFCIDTPAGTPAIAAAGNVTIPVANFYNGQTGATTPLSAWIAGGISRAALATKIDIYDITGKLNGAPHGSPIFTDFMTLGSESGGPPMPEEVAVALTLRAAGYMDQPVEVPDNADPDLVPQRPRQRYTGRIYFGPLNVQATVAGTNDKPRPQSELLTGLRESSQRLKDGLAAAVGGPYIWSVWSRKDAVTRPISHVSTDDAFDTQRRRGTDPSARVLLQLT